MKKACFVLLIASLSLWSGNTTVLSQPLIPAVGPFPSNAFSTPASNQATGLRINLPLPAGCSATSTAPECFNIQQLNLLDGFSLNPRITVCFSGPVDTNTLRSGISISSVDTVAPPVSINQIIFDPIGNCAYAKPDQLLQQQTRYLLTITSDVTDPAGQPLEVDQDYKDCVQKGGSKYCQSLKQVIGKVNGNRSGAVVSASLFTTMSTTSWLQKARAQVNSSNIPGAGVLLGRPLTFQMSAVKAITWMPDTGVPGVNYDQALPLNVLSGVDRIAFGGFLSPLYLNDTGTIDTTATNDAIARPRAVVPVSFHVYLPPPGSNPSAKIPLIIYGHGLSDNQFGAPTFAAATWARKGFATLAIEIPGHGFGPLGMTRVTTAFGSFPIPTPGRGIQFSHTSPIGPSDGCVLPTAIATRDCARQTAVDLFSLVRAIRDTDGLNLNLDKSRIYYVGQSFGASYGTLLQAVEPNVSAGALNSGGGTQVDVARLSPVARQLGGIYLSSFTMPPLLNAYDPTHPDPNPANWFNDEYVYRGTDVVMDKVPGALPVQAAFEAADWLAMLGDPLSYAAHLKNAPLHGVAARRMLLQFGLGDVEIPNPAENAIVRAGGLESAAWVLRTDRAAAIDPRIPGMLQPGVPYPIYPHRFLSNPVVFDPDKPLENALAIAAQSQIADFFASDGKVISDPNGYLPTQYPRLFETTLPPEGLNFPPWN